MTNDALRKEVLFAGDDFSDASNRKAQDAEVRLVDADAEQSDNGEQSAYLVLRTA